MDRVKAGVEAIQADLLSQLHAVDADIDRLVERREEIVRDLRRCRDAFGGIGCRWYPRRPLPGDVDAEPEATRLVTGADLRDTLVEILRSAERPLSLRELHRSVLARGRNVEGRPSQTIANALRAALKRGDARRLRPGVYEAAMPSGS
jgi:hypothetical protein